MRLTSLSVMNYRALRDVTIPLSRFGCLTGENNTGKSSFLQSLSLFFSGTKLDASNFFDESKPIRIAVTFDEITDADLARLAEEHRKKVAGIVKNGRLVLVRVYDKDGKSSLMYSTLMPNEARFSPDSITSLLKGGRPGRSFVARVTEAFPELKDAIDTTMNADVIRQKIHELADQSPDDQKIAIDQPLPTGIDKSIEPMLPDPIYIPAVRDLADDIKTTESAPFGKIMAILVRAIEPKLPDAQQLFERLNAKLNRVQQPDGTEVDNRLDIVRGPWLGGPDRVSSVVQVPRAGGQRLPAVLRRRDTDERVE